MPFCQRSWISQGFDCFWCHYSIPSPCRRRCTNLNLTVSHGLYAKYQRPSLLNHYYRAHMNQYRLQISSLHLSNHPHRYKPTTHTTSTQFISNHRPPPGMSDTRIRVHGADRWNNPENHPVSRHRSPVHPRSSAVISGIHWPTWLSPSQPRNALLIVATTV